MLEVQMIAGIRHDLSRTSAFNFFIRHRLSSTYLLARRLCQHLALRRMNHLGLEVLHGMTLFDRKSCLKYQVLFENCSLHRCCTEAYLV